MKQPTVPAGGRLPWFILGRGRIGIAIVAGALVALLTQDLPMEFILLLSYDVAVLVYLALFVLLMRRASPDDSAKISRHGEPSGQPILLVVVALSVMTLVGVAAMLSKSNANAGWVTNLHMAASQLAVLLSWFLSNIFFGLHYMRLYYDDTIIDGKTTYQEGLEYPERKAADFWDFMYYSFTIAMCYQTSDVTITSVKMRRVTLLHAIYAFIFVTAIIGLVVNIISNIV